MAEIVKVKCDEKHPSCAQCEKRNVTCRWHHDNTALEPIARRRGVLACAGCRSKKVSPFVSLSSGSLSCASAKLKLYRQNAEAPTLGAPAIAVSVYRRCANGRSPPNPNTELSLHQSTGLLPLRNLDSIRIVNHLIQTPNLRLDLEISTVENYIDCPRSTFKRYTVRAC